MTNETTPDLRARISDAPANTTVFSDGSTFDYENGYQSNGAPVATRDRTENPVIVKSHRVVTLPRVIGFAGIIVAIYLVLICIVLGVRISQRAENSNALKEGIESTGQVKVTQMADNEIFVKRPDGSIFKCDHSVISNNDVPTGLVFCSPGGPATFSIPLPHDPNNVFYTALKMDH